MKTSMILFGAMASVAMAQDLSGFEDLPTCGQTCITNMINQAGDLNCAANDVACLCLNPDFSYGVRDCTDQACGSGSDAADTQSWGVNLCANQGVAVTSVSETVAVSTVSGSSVSTGVTSDLSVSSTLTSTITSDSTTFTSTIPTLVPIVSKTGVSTTTKTTTTAAETTTKSTTQNSGNDSPTTTDSTDAAPRATAAVGFMAAAGLAALLI